MGGEGIDMPNVDAVIFATAHAIEPVRVIQALGRTLRRNDDISARGIMRINRSTPQLCSVIEALWLYDHRLRKLDVESAVTEHFKPCDGAASATEYIVSQLRRLDDKAEQGRAGKRGGTDDPPESKPDEWRNSVEGQAKALQLTFDPDEAIDRERSSSSGFLYLISEGSRSGATGDLFLKVGRSIDPKSRLKQLQTGNPRKLELVREWPGPGVEGFPRGLSQLEAAVLGKLSASDFAQRVDEGGTEWFRLSSSSSLAAVGTFIGDVIIRTLQTL